jgi:hypothetical protein
MRGVSVKKKIDLKALLFPPGQWQAIRPALAWIGGVTLCLISIVLYMHFVMDVPTWYMVCDMTVLFKKAKPYCAFLSQLGLLLWAAAAAVSLLTAAVLSKTHEMKGFFQFSGWLTLYLCLDDAFLIHDKVMPGLGIREIISLPLYLGVIIFYLFKYRAVIFKTEYLLMGMALFFFACSIGQDVVNLRLFGDPYIFEDGAKFIGILIWLAYFFFAGRTVIQREASR